MVVVPLLVQTKTLRIREVVQLAQGCTDNALF